MDMSDDSGHSHSSSSRDSTVSRVNNFPVVSTSTRNSTTTTTTANNTTINKPNPNTSNSSSTASSTTTPSTTTTTTATKPKEVISCEHEGFTIHLPESIAKPSQDTNQDQNHQQQQVTNLTPQQIVQEIMTLGFTAQQAQHALQLYSDPYQAVNYLYSMVQSHQQHQGGSGQSGM
mmetsp:Transcript_35376/g.40161  ORF Transcript_35376/g.40161 Transcript_35376/m.40161 type:complete len:175 (-) Transcript_35376:409-933(-)